MTMCDNDPRWQAYLTPNDRARSLAIWAEVARRLGVADERRDPD